MEIKIQNRILALTGPEGTYRIENAPVGFCSVEARDRKRIQYLVPHRQGAISSYYNYSQYQEVFLEPGKETCLDMQVIEGARIKGKVIDNQGRPVGKTYIWIVNQSMDNSIVAAETGELGDYESFALAPNIPLEFLVWSGDRRGSARKVLSLKPGTTTSLDFTLNPDDDFRIQGTVMDTEGRRIPNMQLRCWWNKDRNQYRWDAKSDVEGNYCFSGLEADVEYMVYAYGQPLGYETANQVITLTMKDRVGTLDFRMKKPTQE